LEDINSGTDRIELPIYTYRDGTTLDQTTIDSFLDPVNWPASGISTANAALLDDTMAQDLLSSLEMTIAVDQTTFDLGADIPVNVTYRNISGEPIEVMNRVVPEGYPLRFVIVNQQTGYTVPFIAPEYKLRLEDSDFTTLAAGESLTVTVNLVRNAQGVARNID
jgi:hypothetical protein